MNTIDGSRKELSFSTVEPLIKFAGDHGIRIDSPTDRKSLYSWNDFCAIMASVSQHSSLAELEEYGVTSPKGEFEVNRTLIAMSSYFANARQLYWMLSKWYIPKIFPMIAVTLTDLQNARLQLTMEIKPTYQEIDSGFFHIWAGVMRAAPLTLGQPFALVRFEASPRKGVFTITPPPSTTIFSRLLRAWRVVFAARGALEELSAQQRQIRSHYEELLEQRVKLDIASQMTHLARMSALGEMAGGLSHEINNPLAAINLSIELLKRQLKVGPLDPLELETHLDSILALSQRISRIIKELRSFARETENSPMECAEVSTLVDRALDFCRERFKSFGIHLETEIPKTPLSTECHQSQIVQVLMNLLQNSFESVVKQHDKWIRIEVKASPQKIWISITDSGPPIPAPNRERLFEPFFTTKEIGTGTGLGLSVAKGIIDAHHGMIKLDTTSRDTSFVVELPRK